MENYEFILGVDVSRNFLDIHCLERSEHIHIENGKKGFKALIRWCKEHQIDLKKSIVVMEYTGGYEYRLISFCEAKHLVYVRLPGLEIKRSMGITRGKNDKIDAKRIAQYADEKHKSLKPSKPYNHKIEGLKQLLGFRKKLVQEKAGYQSRIKERKQMYPTLRKDFILKESKRQLRLKENAIKRVEQEIMDLLKSDKEIWTNYQLITSIRGIGLVNASMTIAYTENFTSFKDGRSYAVYVGVVPFDYLSGTSIRRRKRVSHLANKKLKAELNQAARIAMLYDPELKQYAERKLEDKAYGVVLNNVKFKLILRMFAVVKRGSKYVDNYQQAA